MSWPCSAIVDVATTTLSPDATAGARYARLFPGTGRCNGDEVVSAADRVAHGARELTLTVTLLAGETGHGRVEHGERVGAP